MRDRCPACHCIQRVADWEMDFKVPDGWPQPKRNTICVCLGCGLIYYDNECNADDYDEYYRHYYGYDGNLNIHENDVRLDGVVELVKRFFPTHFKIIDFGGGDGYLERKLKQEGYQDVITVRVDDALPEDANLVIATQVFEHLYDLRGTLDRLRDAMIPRGIFLIEVPDALDIAFLKGSAIKDYQQKHVNHFTPQALNNLFGQIGYDCFYSERGEMTGYFGTFYRAIYSRNTALDVYAMSKVSIQQAVKAKLEKLRKVKGRVIVWGCGDLAMHLLAQADLDVAYYVDNDPAFRGATIDGVPVLDKVTSSEPIIVMAQNQASALLKRIRDEGLENEVIVI